MAKKPKFQVRTVKTKEDRKRPSIFNRLKTGESFRAFALFEPDPELEGNPGYYEYYDHYDRQANQYVPCIGEKCSFCRANDNPSTRALTLWYFPDNDADEKLKVFTMNFRTIQDITDESEENDGILGAKIRIKRTGDMGEYRVTPTTDKALAKKEIQKLLSDAPDLQALVEKQAAVQIERLKAVDALEDDDDDDEEEETATKKGKAVTDEDDEDDEEEEETEEVENIEDEEFELVSVSKKKNSVTVEHNGEEIELTGDEEDLVSGFKKGAEVVISAEYDEDDEEWTLTEIKAKDDDDEEEEEEEDEEKEDDEDDDEEEDEEGISGESFEVVKTQENEEIVTVKGGRFDKNTQLWAGEGVDVDFDEVKKGVKVTVDAEQDDEGDWIITDLSVDKKKSSKGKGKSKTKK